MDVISLVLVPRPLRMMLLHPGMVVPHPPVAIMPRVMVVVVTYDGRSLVYDRGSAVHMPLTIGVRVRPVRRVISLPTVTTFLERDRSTHENHRPHGREKIAHQFASQFARHWSCPSPEGRSIKDASQ